MPLKRTTTGLWSLLATIGFALLGLEEANGQQPPPRPATSETVATTGSPLKSGIDVQGNRLLKDGRTWIPKGVGMGAFTYAPYFSGKQSEDAKGFIGAAQRFGPEILDAAQSWKIDSVRFLVSQPGLDPQSDLYSAKYVSSLTEGVKLCLSKGLAVVIAMQDEPHSGETDVKDLPTAHTLRAWNTIGPVFANHPYVMFELFNECGMPVKTGELPSIDRENWTYWLQGGKHKGRVYVGHQTLVAEFRKRGWNNVLIVDGIGWARILDPQVLRLKDPIGRMAYAVHPYFTSYCNSRPEWDTAFGDLSRRAPVVVTEWFANSKCPFGVKSYQSIEWSREFLAYLRERQIPLWAFAFDIPSTIVKDYQGTPNTWDGFAPGNIEVGTPGAGTGALVKAHFVSQPDSPETPEQGVAATPGKGLAERLAGTKWLNSNNVEFEWTSSGDLLHKGRKRPYRVEGSRITVDFGDHEDTLVFDAALTSFEQFSTLTSQKRPLFTGRRIDRKP